MYLLKDRRVKRIVAAVVACAWLSGCAHQLEIKNLSLYTPTMISSSASGTKVGLVAETITPEEGRLIVAIANALKRDGINLTYPFISTPENLHAVDYAVKVITNSQYMGSSWNFLINWPGFLIWAPAWHGYNYRALFKFDIDITDAKTNASMPRISAPVDLDIRHAALNRTWTEISWLEWSAIAFVGGLVFTRYDRSITPSLIDATENKIADYVASKITSAIAASKH